MTAATSRAMTLRLDDDLAECLTIVAWVENQPIAEVVRTAITDYLARKAASR
jgi:predicted transcriptional regulator